MQSFLLKVSSLPNTVNGTRPHVQHSGLCQNLSEDHSSWVLLAFSCSMHLSCKAAPCASRAMWQPVLLHHACRTTFSLALLMQVGEALHLDLHPPPPAGPTGGPAEADGAASAADAQAEPVENGAASEAMQVSFGCRLLQSMWRPSRSATQALALELGSGLVSIGHLALQGPQGQNSPQLPGPAHRADASAPPPHEHMPA